MDSQAAGEVDSLDGTDEPTAEAQLASSGEGARRQDGGPAIDSRACNEIGGTDIDGNNNSQNVESNSKIYNNTVT